MGSKHRALLDDSDGYFARNFDVLVPEEDRLTQSLDKVNASSPIQRLLEVGCTNGWRLSAAAAKFGCEVVGVEAGATAVHDGRQRFPEVSLYYGLAPEVLETDLSNERFDCIALGMFMYVLPREDLFRLASIVDALLSDDGHLVVQDFLYPSSVQSDYAHSTELQTFKSDPSAPWTWSPMYTLMHRDVYGMEEPSNLRHESSWVTVDVLRKHSIQVAYPRITAMPSTHRSA